VRPVNRHSTPAGSNSSPARTQPSASAAGACAATPPGREGASLAYDAARGQVLMFGGSGSAGSMNDTWVKGAGCWTQSEPSVSPPTRDNAAIAFDPVHNLTVMYGGIRHDPGKAVVILSDTWQWDGVNWIEVHPSPAPVLVAPVGAFDVATSQFVVFGFNNIGSQPETWTWNGSQWLHVHPSSTPGARTSSSMAYDYSSRKIVLFGGFNNATGGSLDTWTWDGTTWTQQRPPTSPGGQGWVCGGWPLVLIEASAWPNPVASPSRGNPATLRTWFWDSNDWKSPTTMHSPPNRLNPECAFTGSEVVLFGGWGESGQLLSDTWVFRNSDWTREN
jgi:hypothetical protein